MNIRFITLLSIISFYLGLSSCASSKQATKSTTEKGLLWEINGKGIAKPSYVYGTIHMIPSQEYFLPKGTLGAIDKCEQMYFEIDMKDMSDMTALFGMMNKIFMKDGLTLKDLLSEQDYKLVNSKFTELGIPIFLLERIKPMFLSAFAMGDMNPTALQDGKIKSYEMEFYEIAKTKKMKTGGLETIDFQISVFDSIPYKDQAKMLVDGIKNSTTDNDEFKKMIQLYKDQDIEKMITMMGEGASDLGEHEDILLSGRNKNWIPQIIALAQKQPTFIAVGAGHLGGPKGVINLLRKEGYIVKAVK
jgi:uncharacterized protein